MSSTKYTGEVRIWSPGTATAVALCSPEDHVSNIENKFHCTVPCMCNQWCYYYYYYYSVIWKEGLTFTLFAVCCLTIRLLRNLTHWAFKAVKVSLFSFCPATVITWSLEWREVINCSEIFKINCSEPHSFDSSYMIYTSKWWKYCWSHSCNYGIEQISNLTNFRSDKNSPCFAM